MTEKRDIYLHHVYPKKFFRETKIRISRFFNILFTIIPDGMLE